MSKRPIKSYVLRNGRISPRQKLGLEHVLVNYQLPLSSWQTEAFFDTPHEKIVEIGFGMGGSLLEMAKASPQTHFIGIEVHPAGIGAFAADLHDQNIENVRIAPYDACLIFSDCIPKQSLSGVQLFFPDPWPKKRHHKRRLIQPAFVNLVAEALLPGGFLHIATDWENYAEFCLNILSQHPSLSNVSTTNTNIPRPASRPLTKFETRGQKLGHGIVDLMFKKIPPSKPRGQDRGAHSSALSYQSSHHKKKNRPRQNLTLTTT